jgi:hypothetical protein
MNYHLVFSKCDNRCILYIERHLHNLRNLSFSYGPFFRSGIIIL